MLKAEQIHKTFDSLEVLKGIDLSVHKAEIVAIVGPSGAGKTTLLQILGLLDKADPGGRVLIEGRDTSGLSDNKLAEIRNRYLGFVFQQHQLLPEFTALENVMIPGLIMRRKREELRRAAAELLDTLGLSARKEHKPSELSGGERQRVAVARAMINHPAIILADEPSGSLDSRHKEELHSLFFELRHNTGQSFLIVTHDEGLAMQCDRRICLSDGKIEGIITQNRVR
ncbi:lipoprotein ABC transporter ATP-binding protein [Porphyromonas crevioricanis]|uniref:Lipoprotein ABC transporter ATP-binding protein n=1 Tax=Porphyromonas crevioricanis TaxID=393921 RepID=A0AB34PFZ3_9PORP|nr:ABC transporter ATP-binding protein [Porphyromonas crevioricanis]KGN91320.1 lipoprotein ABC transporter ATP-binding protein [Porphyromonas crevioricanis]KGN94342.1 lipoprotein ABC transporter ATP-binding protein [Porphyromonas crevioricanis]